MELPDSTKLEHAAKKLHVIHDVPGTCHFASRRANFESPEGRTAIKNIAIARAVATMRATNKKQEQQKPLTGAAQSL